MLAAKNWTNFPTVERVSYIIPINAPITETAPVISTYAITADFVVEHVEVVFLANHTNRGDLEIGLVSPSGSQSILSQVHSDPASDVFWRYSSIVHWSESSKGMWTLSVNDGNTNSRVGIAHRWELTIYGHYPQIS